MAFHKIIWLEVSLAKGTSLLSRNCNEDFQAKDLGLGLCLHYKYMEVHSCISSILIQISFELKFKILPPIFPRKEIQKNPITISAPDNILTAGNTYRRHVTLAETGLPGNPMTNRVLPKYVQVANVVGLPGFMLTLAK